MGVYHCPGLGISLFFSLVYGGMSSTIVGQDPALISSWKLTVRYYAIFTRMESQFKAISTVPVASIN
ncbi:hypothetical protein HanPSC8_Chr12g0517811 [Helianthus annuus]|nr:hypothetical protein HanPSC8_Chr12g0517811 [Helianthus annuus]